MEVVFLIGRILFVFIFVMAGAMFHLTQGAIEYTRSKGIPAPGLAAPLSGVLIVLGGLSIALGIWADLGALVLAAFLFSTAFLFHAFWQEGDPQTKQLEQQQFMKDIALAGAALIIFYAYNQLQGEAGLSITDPLFDRG